MYFQMMKLKSEQVETVNPHSSCMFGVEPLKSTNGLDKVLLEKADILVIFWQLIKARRPPAC